MNEQKTDMQASEVSLVYRSRVPKTKRKQISNSMDAFRILWEYWNKDTIEHHEQFKVLLLNNKNDVLGIAEISQGGISSTLVDPRIVYQYCLKAHASSIVVAHNHPSNKPTPSESDVEITKKLVEAGKVLNIAVLDHIILCADGSYFSLGDEGRM